jgi:formylglycine-generating enzyme required for sulfatase activity
VQEYGEKIFISYQRDSAPIAERLRLELIAEGFSAWLDSEEIAHSDRWPVTINRALADADRLLVLLTRKASDSVEVFNEWFYFYKHRKPIHVIRLDDCEPHYQLLPFQRLEWAGRTETQWPALVGQLVSRLRTSYFWPVSDPAGEAVVTSPFAPSRSLSGALAALEQALRHSDQPVALSAEQLQEIHAHPSRDLRDYWLSCYARWCRPQYQLDRRFVHLTLVVDEGTESPDRWVALPSARACDDLREILASSDWFAYVLLGAPGSGKTTLLRRLEMDVARDGVVAPETATVPFSVSLAEYGLSPSAGSPAPLAWLERRWSTRNPHLPPLRQFIDDGRVLLLVDGLNELPHYDSTDLRRRIDAWRVFLYEHFRDVPGNRAVFTCRTLDYGAMLSSKDVGVPHIRLEPMTSEQVWEYLDLHLPEHADIVRAALLRDNRTLSFYRTPYMLRLLVGQVRAVGTVPVGRVDAFTAMVRELLRREILAGNQRLANVELLTDREQRRLRDGVSDPMWLPEHGHLIPALTRLAFQMQFAKRGEDKGSVVVDYETAVELLNGLARLAESSLQVGFDTGILDEREQAVGFFHQLLQEFFAARQLAGAGDLSHLAVATATEAVEPALADLLAELSAGEPLPPLPTSGWEETAVMAAALAPDPDTFIQRVLTVNPALAGRCVAAPDVSTRPQTRQAVANRLLAGVSDSRADLRARIAFGRVLGLIDDPRYTRLTSDHGSALVPGLASVPARTHRIGATGTPYPLENPVHEVYLDGFDLARWPVTNSEYGCFIAAGGYDDDQWWHSDNARRWRSGDGVLDLIANEWVKKRETLRRRPHLPVDMLRAGAATLQQAVSMVKLTTMDDGEIRDALSQTYGRGPTRWPAFWHDSRFNRPSCPVVGVSIYEAEAYCAWLSAVTGQTMRLPTEYEWEAAARAGGQVFPYGDEADRYAANTFELHVRTTTPVGVFPSGVSPIGCHDLSGNVFEWTASTYAPYPYPVGALHSDEPSAVRICRGGSWRHHQIRARAAYRGRGQSFVRNDDLGFRIARTMSHPPSTSS